MELEDASRNPGRKGASSPARYFQYARLRKRFCQLAGRLLGHRSTDMPGKQLIYMRLHRDAPLSEGKPVGVDFGCNIMNNYPFVRTAEYYGVELDAEALKKGLARYPTAHAVHSKIELAEVPAADFAICIHVFDAHNFDDSDPVQTLEAILSKMKPGGTLIITLRNNSSAPKLLAMLRSAFQQVDEFPHGLANTPKTLLAPMIAAWHFHTSSTPRQVKEIYCRCQGRLALSGPAA